MFVASYDQGNLKIPLKKVKFCFIYVRYQRLYRIISLILHAEMHRMNFANLIQHGFKFDISLFRFILLLIMRGHIYIFIFVPVWQKNNKSLTPVSQVNYRNFCPNLSSLSFTEAY